MLRIPAALGVLAALIAHAALAGCFGPPTVRVALVEETYAFDERAPAEAAEAIRLAGCSGSYDAGARALTLVRREDAGDMRPTFAFVLQRTLASTGPAGLPDPSAGRSWPMLASAGGGWPDIPAFQQWMSERGSAGGWGYGTPYGSANAIELAWSKEGVAVDGEPLRDGGVLTRELVDEVSHEGVAFEVRQTLAVSYLGRLPYRLADAC